MFVVVSQVREVLGVEAARKTIIREIHKTMDAYGIGIDARHLMLLADTMTNMVCLYCLVNLFLLKSDY